MPEYPDPTVGAIDFGFSNPFAALWGHLDNDDCLWVTGERYVRQCTLPTHSEAIPKGVRYWCDPAEPDSIRELRIAGHDAVPCVHLSGRGAAGEIKKPKLAGIDRVSERIRQGKLKVVRSKCPNLVREFGLYHYDPEKLSEDPVKEDDHTMDALRYLITGIDRGRAIPVAYEPDPPPPERPARSEDSWYEGGW